jgi:hypothetical protein
MPVHQQPPTPQPAYSRPLPDDPSWAPPPYYHPQMNPYAAEPPSDELPSRDVADPSPVPPVPR